MDSIRDYELRLSTELLKLVSQIDGVTVYGIGESEVRGRVPTFCFNLRDVNPAAVTVALAAKGIGVRDGNMYSPRLLDRLGIPTETGAIRASLAHYNTVSEVGRFAEELRAIARG
jgi:selenocysteine lyase/cysteine desulfurase